MQKNLQHIKPAIHPKDSNIKKLKTRVSLITFLYNHLYYNLDFDSGMIFEEFNIIKSKELDEKKLII